MELKHKLPGIAELNLEPMRGGRIRLEATRHFNELGVQRAVFQLLRNFGVDMRDPNFAETAKRVTKMWNKWLEPQEVNLAVFESDAKGAVCLYGHKAVSVCPHHLLPFEMIVDLAYVPQGYVVGLSKLSRLIDLACASFALQEHIPDFVVKVMTAILIPRGAICRVRARHGCMRLRGVRTSGEVITTALDGVYLTDEKARHEFLAEQIKEDWS